MNGLNKKPEIVVFAGSNGSGKSTFTALLKPSMDYINADEIKNGQKFRALKAGKEKRLLYPVLLYSYC